MQAMDTILVLRVGWMEHYQGMDDDSIQSNATFVQQESYGHEMFNFLPEHGHMYGYVQPSGHGAYDKRQINISRLGAPANADSIDHILVAWVAPRKGGGIVLIGWYQDATVYRWYQSPPSTTQRLFQGEAIGYYVTASQENCILLKPHERVLLVPKAKGDSGGIGQSLVWYADTTKENDTLFRAQFLAFMQAYNHQQLEMDLNNVVYAPDYFVEGRSQQVLVTVYERNLQARASCITYYGVQCVICQFDFAATYGSVGANYIHVHHLTPIASQMKSYQIDPIRDLRPVCPNCHAIMHRRNPPYSLGEMARFIAKRDAKPSGPQPNNPM